VIHDKEEDIEEWLPKVYADGQVAAAYFSQCFMTTRKRKPALRVILYYVAYYSNGVPKWKQRPVGSITPKPVPRRRLIPNLVEDKGGIEQQSPVELGVKRNSFARTNLRRKIKQAAQSKAIAKEAHKT
jgi:hypothetical protein